jgi:hypothetical protein
MGATLCYAGELYVIETGVRQQQINLLLSNEPQRLVTILGCENNLLWGARP